MESVDKSWAKSKLTFDDETWLDEEENLMKPEKVFPG